MSRLYFSWPNRCFYSPHTEMRYNCCTLALSVQAGSADIRIYKSTQYATAHSLSLHEAIVSCS